MDPLPYILEGGKGSGVCLYTTCAADIIERHVNFFFGVEEIQSTCVASWNAIHKEWSNLILMQLLLCWHK